jgi:hypothetical protein
MQGRRTDSSLLQQAELAQAFGGLDDRGLGRAWLPAELLLGAVVVDRQRRWVLAGRLVGSQIAVPASSPLLPVQQLVPLKEEKSSGTTTKTLTNKQKLAKALKACQREKSKGRRVKCEKQALGKYAPSKQAKKGKRFVNTNAGGRSLGLPVYCPGGIRHTGSMTPTEALLLERVKVHPETAAGRPVARGRTPSGGIREEQSTVAGSAGGLARSSCEARAYRSVGGAKGGVVLA